MSQVVAIQSNLVITRLSAPVEADLYSCITVSWMVQNHGPATTTSTFWGGSIYSSLDESLADEDWFLLPVAISTASGGNGNPMENPFDLPLASEKSCSATQRFRLRDRLSEPILIDRWIGVDMGGMRTSSLPLW